MVLKGLAVTVRSCLEMGEETGDGFVGSYAKKRDGGLFTNAKGWQGCQGAVRASSGGGVVY